MDFSMNCDRSHIGRLEAAFAAADDAAYEWNLATGAIKWLTVEAPAWLDRVGSLAFFDEYLTCLDPAGASQLRDAHASARLQGNRYRCQYALCLDEGRNILVEDRGRFEIDGETMLMVGTLRRLDEGDEAEAYSAPPEDVDHLTGQYNRRRLSDALEHALEYSQQYDQPGIYLQIGIDNLPLIQDSYGQEVAENVVVAVSRELDRSLRASDIMGRIARDQFGVVLNGCQGQDISATAEKLLIAAQQASVVTENGHLPVTASVGAVAFPESVRATEEAFSKAEVALEKARRSGTNCFSLYDLSETQLRDLRSSLETAELVQQALRENLFTLHFQPIVDVDGSAPAFYECLLRMRGADGKIMAAGNFLPVAEKLGLVRSIDRVVLEMVARELQAAPDVKLALNISGLSTTDPSWLRALTAVLSGQPEIASRLMIEITETTALLDIDETTRFVAAVREMGCQVALDDFGAGYTSFRHLQELCVDVVKIDGSFIKTIVERPNSQLFVKTLRSFAEGLGVTTVAECVETEAAAHMLIDHGIHYLQGFHFGRPSPARPWLGKDLSGVVPLDEIELYTQQPAVSAYCV
jgi:diguanylate cyclase (GGDEF)-like protein